MNGSGIYDVAHAIQLALAPVFLLTGIAGILNVMAQRLARIIDRSRFLEGAWAHLPEELRDAAQRELASLEHRRRLASWAINACTAAALLVCLVISALFAEALVGLPLQWLAGVLFTFSTLSLVAGLSLFLREVHLATRMPHVRTVLTPRG